MGFPFSVRYTKPLKVLITDDNLEETLSYIKTKLQERSGDNIQISGWKVSYKGSKSFSSWNVLRNVDRGVFEIVSKEGMSFLTYEFFMHELFIFTSIVSVIASIFSEEWWIGIVAFLWLCGMNWLINLARHEDLAAVIAIGIDDLYCKEPPKETEETEEPDEKLKSWF